MVLYLEHLLKVADLNSERKVILLSTGRKKEGKKDCLLDLVVQCHDIDFKIWVSLNFLRHYKGPQHEYFNNLLINY